MSGSNSIELLRIRLVYEKGFWRHSNSIQTLRQQIVRTKIFCTRVIIVLQFHAVCKSTPFCALICLFPWQIE
jgi:hypothetical protein